MTTLSIIIVSFNTKELLRKCLRIVQTEVIDLDHEIIVVDNASSDGSAKMVESVFPEVLLIESEENLGFAGGNNLGFEAAQGKFIVLLNSDAFLRPGALNTALKMMHEYPNAGIGGAKLIAENGFFQPAARMFPSVLNEILQISGLADKFPSSSFLGRADRTWSDTDMPCRCDWVPGAFIIIRRAVLDKIGPFDSDFFLYFEEVDFCLRAKVAGFEVWYWPEIEIVHLGGESSKTLKKLYMSQKGSQLELWRMRSQLLFYRKHFGLPVAYLSALGEKTWHRLRGVKNRMAGEEIKTKESERIVALLTQAWKETQGGRYSPTKPW